MVSFDVSFHERQIGDSGKQETIKYPKARKFKCKRKVAAAYMAYKPGKRAWKYTATLFTKLLPCSLHMPNIDAA
jgi:hypothetical protein